MSRELLERIASELMIINHSQGIAGYHLNGEIQPWGHTEFPSIFEDVEAELAKPEAEPVGWFVDLGDNVKSFTQYKHIAESWGDAIALYISQPDQSARIAELEQQLDALTQSNVNKIMAMSDAQIDALTVMEGHNPEDVVSLGKKTAEIALLKYAASKAYALLWDWNKDGEFGPYPKQVSDARKLLLKAIGKEAQQAAIQEMLGSNKDKGDR